MQQISRVIVENDDLTDSEREYINGIVSINLIKEYYCDYLYDEVKFRIIDEGDQSKLGTIDFFTNWLSIIVRHPILAVRAYVDQTVSYWNPSNKYGKWCNSCYNIHGIEFKINNEFLNEWIQKYSNATESNFILIHCWDAGLVVWIIFFLLVFALYRKNNNYIYLLPIIALLCTIYLTVMLDAEFRYVYFMFASLPITTFSIFTSNNKDKINGINNSNALSK